MFHKERGKQRLWMIEASAYRTPCGEHLHAIENTRLWHLFPRGLLLSGADHDLNSKEFKISNKNALCESRTLRFSLGAFCNGTVKAFMDTVPFLTPITRTWSLNMMVPERLLLTVFDFHWVFTTDLLDFFTLTCNSGIPKFLKCELLPKNLPTIKGSLRVMNRWPSR